MYNSAATVHHCTMLSPKHLRWVCFAGAFFCAVCVPAQSPSEVSGDNSTLAEKTLPNASPAAHCAALSVSNPALAPMSKLCEFAASYLKKIPDFVCEQTTSSQSTRGFRRP